MKVTKTQRELDAIRNVYADEANTQCEHLAEEQSTRVALSVAQWNLKLQTDAEYHAKLKAVRTAAATQPNAPVLVAATDGEVAEMPVTDHSASTMPPPAAVVQSSAAAPDTTGSASRSSRTRTASQSVLSFTPTLDATPQPKRAGLRKQRLRPWLFHHQPVVQYQA